MRAVRTGRPGGGTLAYGYLVPGWPEVGTRIDAGANLTMVVMMAKVCVWRRL